MTRNQRIGKWGEQAAADYLKEHGYEIVAGNVRTPYGEIDLIAKKDDFFIFIEVYREIFIKWRFLWKI